MYRIVVTFDSENYDWPTTNMVMFSNAAVIEELVFTSPLFAFDHHLHSDKK